MNKVFIFLFFICLTLFYCSSSVNINLNKGIVSEHIFHKDTLIVGEWTINTYVINGGTLNCYSCSRIQFFGDGKGKIKTPTNHEYKFRYSLIGDKFLLNSKTPELLDLLCKNTEFHYDIKDEGAFLHLNLSSITGDCKLILSKAK